MRLCSVKVLFLFFKQKSAYECKDGLVGSEVCRRDRPSADCWYKTKLQFITIDDKTEKEKRSTVNYLVHAGSLPQAVNNIDEVMGGTMIDYVISSVAETQIMDVFEHNKIAAKPQADDKPEYEQENNTEAK